MLRACRSWRPADRYRPSFGLRRGQCVLGRIGAPAAAKALNDAPAAASAALQLAVADARLACAERLANDGHTAQAEEIYRSLERVAGSKRVRIAATAGLLALADKAEKPQPALVAMVIDLLAKEDRDLQALAIQEIRERVKGSAATRAFSAQVATRPPATQADLVEALADRGDAAALPVMRSMLNCPATEVRTAAIRSLGLLGGAANVRPLVDLLATDAKPDRTTARESLLRLEGDGVSQAIGVELAKRPAKVRVELIGVLAARRVSMPCLTL